MKKQTLKAIGGASMAILMLVVLAQVWVSAQDKGSAVLPFRQSLVGSWDVLVTARDCETGAPIPFIPIFPAIMTYDQGGTMQETDLGAPGLVRLPGHGVWRRNGQQYAAAFRFLNFGPDRTFLGKNVIRSAISISQSGDEYSSTDTLEIIGANGEVVTGCSTTTATRFE